MGRMAKLRARVEQMSKELHDSGRADVPDVTPDRQSGRSVSGSGNGGAWTDPGTQGERDSSEPEKSRRCSDTFHRVSPPAACMPQTAAAGGQRLFGWQTEASSVPVLDPRQYVPFIEVKATYEEPAFAGGH